MEFAYSEYESRWARLREEMFRRKLDAIFVDEAENIRYLCGYLPTAARHQFLFIPLEGPITACIRRLDEPAFVGATPIENTITFDDDEIPTDYIGRLIAGAPGEIRSLGIESDSCHLTPARYSSLVRSLPCGVQAVSTDSLVREVRLRKSDVEIATLGRAARIADLTVEHLALTCAPRHTTRELAAAGYQFALKAGADNGRLLLLSAGRGEVVFHGQLNDEQVKVGDIVHVEAVPQVRGYSARIMRPISVGPPTPETRDIASTLIDIQDRQIDAMVHGASAREVDALCREPMIQSGLRDCYPNATAYTLGLHATPKTSDFTRALLPGCDWSLEEGMVFHVYTAAGSLAFSETILVRQDHSERLTHAARRVYVADSDK